ncbi:unnamed protein product [Rhodiola kirilowii]
MFGTSDVVVVNCTTDMLSKMQDLRSPGNAGRGCEAPDRPQDTLPTNLPRK